MQQLISLLTTLKQKKKYLVETDKPSLSKLFMPPGGGRALSIALIAVLQVSHCFQAGYQPFLL